MTKHIHFVNLSWGLLMHKYQYQHSHSYCTEIFVFPLADWSNIKNEPTAWQTRLLPHPSWSALLPVSRVTLQSGLGDIWETSGRHLGDILVTNMLSQERDGFAAGFDLNGEIYYVSQDLCQLLRTREEKTLGKSLDMFLTHTSWVKLIHEMDCVMNTSSDGTKYALLKSIPLTMKQNIQRNTPQNIQRRCELLMVVLLVSAMALFLCAVSRHMSNEFRNICIRVKEIFKV